MAAYRRLRLYHPRARTGGHLGLVHAGQPDRGHQGRDLSLPEPFPRRGSRRRGAERSATFVGHRRGCCRDDRNSGRTVVPSEAEPRLTARGPESFKLSEPFSFQENAALPDRATRSVTHLSAV